jgi:CRISPR/Cas system-associated exonuclease Cas4 (RecB family)
MRFMRQMRKWTPADGYVHPRAEAKLALGEHSLKARSYSATALQKFTACPYRFFLHTILKISPREVPAAIEAIDPLQRGSLIHEVQYALLVVLRDEGVLPITSGNLEPAMARLDNILTEKALEYQERLAPAIEKVWTDGIALIRSDLREWLRQLSRELNWYPWRFELAFGLSQTDGCDPEYSTSEPANLDCGIQLRGAIDIVERRREIRIVGSTGTSLRATDTKTGRVAVSEGAIIDGGKALQPVLYSLALEKLVPEAHIDGGRLAYSTSRGGFEVRDIPLSEAARAAARELATVLESHLDNGFLPAAPRERECNFCDYRMVCDSNREERTQQVKMPQSLFELKALRTRR